MSVDDYVLRTKRRVEIACLSGYYALPHIVELLEDQVPNEAQDFEPPLDEATEQALVSVLSAHARAVWQRAVQEEATWTSHTPLDRLDQALRDLDRDGFAFCKTVGCPQEDDLSDAGWWVDDADPLQDPGRRWTFWLHVDYDGARLTASGEVPWPLDLRRDEFQPIIDEVVRVMKHHGIAAGFIEARRRIEVGPLPFQRRRTSPPLGPPDPAPPKPPAPAPCERCGGKGWVQLDATSFPEVCVCKGGKPSKPTGLPKAATSATAAPVPSSSDEATHPAPPSGGAATRTFVPIVATRAGLVGRAALVGTAIFLAALLWKKLPLAWCALVAIAGGVAAVARAWLRRYDTLSVGPDILECRSGTRVWQLPYDRVHRAYVFGDRWLFETTPPHERFSFSLEGHDAHATELLEALRERAAVKDLAWVSALASAGRLAA